MKPTLLGLVVAATAFAGSTYYFWQQVQVERERSEQVEAQTAALKQRIAELEEVREGMSGFGLEGPAPGAPGDRAVAKSEVPTPAVTAPMEAGVAADAGETFRARPREPSATMQKMMRAQLRANNKRLYADLVAQLGLSEDDANQFYDLLTEQQAANFGQVRGLAPEEQREKLQQSRKQTQAAIEDLLGSDKVATYQEYQETMAVRSEVDMIARQLDAMEHSLTADQRKRLTAALVEEQKRVPQPEYSSYGDNEMYGKALIDWQAQYNERAADRARSILNTDQFASYREYQQWQSEMRENFSINRGNRRMRGGNATMIATPAFVEAVTVPAPPPNRE